MGSIDRIINSKSVYLNAAIQNNEEEHSYSYVLDVGILGWYKRAFHREFYNSFHTTLGFSDSQSEIPHLHVFQLFCQKIHFSWVRLKVIQCILLLGDASTQHSSTKGDKVSQMFVVLHKKISWHFFLLSLLGPPLQPFAYAIKRIN